LDVVLVPLWHPEDQQVATEPTVSTTLAPVLSSHPAGRYLGQTGSEENTFKEFPHSSQELIHIRPLEHIYL
jgi:hypothetical protein